MKTPERARSARVPSPGGNPRYHPSMRNVACTIWFTCPMVKELCAATPTVKTPPGYMPSPEFRIATKPT